jgi:hypothetical protein
MDEMPLFDTLNFDQPIEALGNAAARVTAIKSFICSTDDTPQTWPAVHRETVGQDMAQCHTFKTCAH